MQIEKKNIMLDYPTPDLYMAAYFLTKGIELIGMRRSPDSPRCFFVFSNPLACKIAVKEFYNKKGSVEPKTYAEAIRSLKDRVYAGV